MSRTSSPPPATNPCSRSSRLPCPPEPHPAYEQHRLPPAPLQMPAGLIAGTLAASCGGRRRSSRDPASSPLGAERHLPGSASAHHLQLLAVAITALEPSWDGRFLAPCRLVATVPVRPHPAYGCIRQRWAAALLEVVLTRISRSRGILVGFDGHSDNVRTSSFEIVGRTFGSPSRATGHSPDRSLILPEREVELA
jgi:hypothetical protein